jgi:selenide,water dikinase
VLADPQTSGGLLVAVSIEFVEAFESILKLQGLDKSHLTPFGWLEEKKNEHLIRVL